MPTICWPERSAQIPFCLPLLPGWYWHGKSPVGGGWIAGFCRGLAHPGARELYFVKIHSQTKAGVSGATWQKIASLTTRFAKPKQEISHYETQTTLYALYYLFADFDGGRASFAAFCPVTAVPPQPHHDEPNPYYHPLSRHWRRFADKWLGPKQPAQSGQRITVGFLGN